MNARAILRRLDALALSQLCEHAATLAAERDALADALARAEARASQAEEWAESWRDDFLRLAEDTARDVGITQGGQLVAIEREN